MVRVQSKNLRIMTNGALAISFLHHCSAHVEMRDWVIRVEAKRRSEVLDCAIDFAHSSKHYSEVRIGLRVARIERSNLLEENVVEI